MVPRKDVITRFVLIGTHHAGNVGAAARALKTMGFDDLVLVHPRDDRVLNRARTKESASGAMNVLENTRICSSLESALEGTNIWCATAMPHDMYRKRPERYRYSAPRPYFEDLLNGGTSMKIKDDMLRIAFLFGNEKIGMKEEDIDKCHAIIGIPTNPEFGSLNLASAVQLIAYDWRQALGGF